MCEERFPCGRVLQQGEVDEGFERILRSGHSGAQHAVGATRVHAVVVVIEGTGAVRGHVVCSCSLPTGVCPVAVVTQLAGESMSLTKGAEKFAGAVWERHRPDEDLPPVWGAAAVA